MAPFSRGSNPRGRVSKRKFGIRGHAGRGQKGGHFSHSRLNDIHVSATTQKTELGEDGDFGSSSDEEMTAEISQPNPYKALLQSLNGSDNGTQGKTAQRPNISEAVMFDDLSANEPDPLAEREDQVSDEEAEDVQVEDDPNSQDIFQEHFARVSETTLRQHSENINAALLNISKFDPCASWKGLAMFTARSAPGEPQICTNSSRLSAATLGIKKRLHKKADNVLYAVKEVESYFGQLLFSYADILLCGSGITYTEKLRQLASLHALDHVLKTRDRVIKNNQRASQNLESDEGQLCDQGFTRPKILFLLPTRNACYKMVKSVVSLYEPEQQENRKRFKDFFGREEEPISDSKPQDFRDLFEGNDDDMFRIGLKFTRKTVKYFAQFYNSDMIFASPLGLRMAIGDQSSKNQDYDFLSSIEVIIMDQADALLMQNWEHVDSVFDHLNLQPRDAHGCDFSRVRPWYLDGNARYLRQTVVLSAYNTPEINSIFNSRMLNFSGKYRITPAMFEGLISAPNAMFKQTLYRFEATSPSSEPDARFLYFTTKIIPQIMKRVRNNPGQPEGTLIFVPSYMDFVRLRNHFANSNATNDLSFGSMSEYTLAPEIARTRSYFLKGRYGVVLYTGRLHHFRRYQIRGARRVIFYALPDNPTFYKELAADFPALGVTLGKLGASEVNVQALFSRFDVLRLERIVGTERLKPLLSEKIGDIFEFIP